MSNAQKAKRSPFFKMRKRTIPFDPDNPKLKGFELIYSSKSNQDWLAFAETAKTIQDEATDAAKRLEIASVLAFDVLDGWKGMTPEVLAEIMPECVGPEEVAAMKAELAEKEWTEYPMTLEHMKDACDHSTPFLTIMQGRVKEIIDILQQEMVQRKNASSSGSSTGKPEESKTGGNTKPTGTPKPNTEADSPPPEKSPPSTH